MQILDFTPAVLSVGSLCEEHGYTYEWASGQTPHLTKDGKTILCKTENVVVVVGHRRNPCKTQNFNKNKDDQLRDLPEWLEPFTDNLEDTKCQHPQTILMTQIRNVP